MAKNESSKLNLTIERMIYGGEGLARLPSVFGDATPVNQGRGKAVFVPFVLPGEAVEAQLTEQSSGFARAQLCGVETPSKSRIEPGCPYFRACGGCQYQHIDYSRQVEIKVEILRETLRRMGGIDLKHEIQTHTASPWAYRNRTRVHLEHAPKFALGYYRFRSNDLLPIEQCPISAPPIVSAIKAVEQIGHDSGVPGWIREIEFFINHDESELLLEAHCAAGAFSGRIAADSAEALENFAEQISESISEFTGIAAFEPGQKEKTKNDAPPRLAAVAGKGHLSYRVGSHKYRVSAGAFFQANRYLLQTMVNLVTDDKKGARAIDLYAGAGLFSLPLAEKFGEVTAVEIASPSFADLDCNANGGERKLKAVLSTAQQFLSRKPQADYIVVDPPRSGLGQAACELLAKAMAPQICYVSCDPSTMARDLKLLLASGYKIEEAHLIDMFPQTFHIESIFHLAR